MATPHNKAELHDIAPVVLLPGDPLRAQYVAEQYLENSRQVTGVRNMLGFTGTYQGIPVSVMGSGMGGPSAGIYSYELFSFYGVERIIRIGTAGGLQENTKPGTLVFAMTASTDSRFGYQYQLPGTYSPCASFSLFQKAVEIAQKNKMLFTAGGVFFIRYVFFLQCFGRKSFLGTLGKDELFGSRHGNLCPVLYRSVPKKAGFVCSYGNGFLCYRGRFAG